MTIVMRAILAACITASLFAYCIQYTEGQSFVNPLYTINSSYPYSVGIASYGLYNISNDSGPYQITTNGIFGFDKINSIYAYDSSLQSAQNLSDYGVSLQLNAMLNITAGGNSYAYWVQNVYDFNTSNMTYYLANNVWNATSYTANLSNSTLTGYGNVTGGSTINSNGTITNETFYSYSTNSSSYSFPTYLEPILRLEFVAGLPCVQFGYIENGSAVFYDNVTFAIPNSKAEFLVTPFNQSGSFPNTFNSSQYYDAELVYGGEANGTVANFERMSSTLWLGYSVNGTIRPFPTVAIFGSDTQEAATNISVGQSGGDASVSFGFPNPNETITLHGVPAQLKSYNPKNSPPPISVYTTTVPPQPTPQPSCGLACQITNAYNSIIAWLEQLLKSL